MSTNQNQPLKPSDKVAITERGALALAVMLIDRLGAAIVNPDTTEARQTLEYVRRFLPILRDVSGLAERSPDEQAQAWSVLSAIAMAISESAS